MTEQASQWYFTIFILSGYVLNSAWLGLKFGNWWGAGYWLFAFGISICAMKGLTR